MKEIKKILIGASIMGAIIGIVALIQYNWNPAYEKYIAYGMAGLLFIFLSWIIGGFIIDVVLED